MLLAYKIFEAIVIVTFLLYTINRAEKGKILWLSITGWAILISYVLFKLKLLVLWKLALAL